MYSSARKGSVPETSGKLLSSTSASPRNANPKPSPRNANPKSPRHLRSTLLGSDLYLCPRTPTLTIDSNSFQSSLQLLPSEINEPNSLMQGPPRHQDVRRHPADDRDQPHFAVGQQIDVTDHKNQRTVLMPRLNLVRTHDAAASARGDNADSARASDPETAVRACRARCPDWPRQAYLADTPRGTVLATRSPRGKLWNSVRAQDDARAARVPTDECFLVHARRTRAQECKRHSIISIAALARCTGVTKLKRISKHQMRVHNSV